MSWSECYSRYAIYNQKVNEHLLTASTSLSSESLLQDRGVFFDSIVGTWNHLIVTDILWMNRLQPLSQHLDGLEDLPKPMAMNQVIAARIEDISQLRKAIDIMLVDWCSELPIGDTEQVIKYSNLDGTEFEQPLGLILQHIFNHQTHHRGQITALLGQSGIAYGCTDILNPHYDIEDSASG